MSKNYQTMFAKNKKKQSIEKLFLIDFNHSIESREEKKKIIEVKRENSNNFINSRVKITKKESFKKRNYVI